MLMFQTEIISNKLAEMAEILSSLFEKLDYLDDGYVDGYVSHVGLRRIILETSDFTQQLGTDLSRFLLARAEANLYGRLTLAELIIMAQEVQRGVRRYGYGPRSTIHNAAVSLALPLNQEREDKLSYLDQYSCRPPPMFLLLLSLGQISVFVYHVILLTNTGETVGADGPVYIKSPLILNPDKKKEVWRFLSYCLVHSGYFHITFNVVIQLMLGLPLEMVHRWWRIMLIYLTGVLAGSLSVAVADPHVYLAGASGGVYALIAAHLANVIFNWREMEYPALRLLSFLLVTGVDTGFAVYYRYTGQDNLVSYTAHIAGGVVGLLLGVVLLRNLSYQTWERALWWCSLLVFLGLFLGAIVWNAIEIFVNGDIQSFI